MRWFCKEGAFVHTDTVHMFDCVICRCGALLPNPCTVLQPYVLFFKPYLQTLCTVLQTDASVQNNAAQADKGGVPLAELDIRAVDGGKPMTQSRLCTMLDSAGASNLPGRTIAIVLPKICMLAFFVMLSSFPPFCF